jgi:hypothetical protein
MWRCNADNKCNPLINLFLALLVDYMIAIVNVFYWLIWAHWKGRWVIDRLQSCIDFYESYTYGLKTIKFLDELLPNKEGGGG